MNRCSIAVTFLAATVFVFALGSAFGQDNSHVSASPRSVAITNISAIAKQAPTVTLTNSTNKRVTLAIAVQPQSSGFVPDFTHSTCKNGGALPGNSSCTIAVTFANPNANASSTPENANLVVTFGDGTQLSVPLYGNPVSVSPQKLVSAPPINSTANGAVGVSNGAPANANGAGYSATLVSIADSTNNIIAGSGRLPPTSEGFSTTGGTCAANTVLNSASATTSCNLGISFTNPPDATGPEAVPITFNFSDSLGYVWKVVAPLQGNPGVASQASLSTNLLVFTNLSSINASSPQNITLTSGIAATLSSVVVPTASGFASTSGTTCAANFSFTAGGNCTLLLTFTDPTIPYGNTTQAAIGSQKGTVYFFFSDGSFVTATVRGNPGPMSGALLAIDTPAGNISTPVHVAVYDSQIHNGSVQAVSPTAPCTANDAMFPTDAYVFQGGSWTGCDSGDAFEAALTSNPDASMSLMSAPGALVPYNFTVTTHYQCAPTLNGMCNAPVMCSSAGTTLTINGVTQANPQICSSDSGFLTVTNNESTTFSGTIALTGFSTECGGLIVNSISNLPANGSVTLALAPDSSFCGGFEAQQIKAITAGATTIFPFANDDYQITPFNSDAGDAVTFMVVPYPDNSGATANPNIAQFTPGPNFPGYRCTPYVDLSAPNNPVCAGLQIGCVPGNATAKTPTGDCETYIYSSKLDYALAPDSVENGNGTTIGAPAFLGVHHQNFPPPCTSGSDCYNLNTLVSYDGDCCIKTTGGSDGSAHIDSWNPNNTAQTTVNIFTGFQSPVVDLPAVNKVNAGSAVALKWIQDDNTGQAVTNLSLCTTLNSDGTCTGVPSPWIFVQPYQVTCPNSPTTIAYTAIATGNSGLQNQSTTAPGQYQYNWQTKGIKPGTCAQVVFTYNNGVSFLTPALFEFQ